MKTLSLLFIVKVFSPLETKKVLKIPNETFLRITRYLCYGRTLGKGGKRTQKKHERIVSFSLQATVSCFLHSKSRTQNGVVEVRSRENAG